MNEHGPPTTGLIRFGAFELDPKAGELRKSGMKTRLPEQSLQLLRLLLQQPGEVVTREEMRERLWPNGTFVDFDHSLNAAMKRLREALDDSADNPRFVETLPRHGYRFIYPVDVGAGLSPALNEAPVEDFTRGPSPDGRGEPELASVPQPSPAGERVSRPVGTGEGTPRRRQWVIVVSGGALVAIAAVLLALNIAGLRERIVAIVGAGSVRPREGGALPYPKIESIAVLPLENLSGDKEQEYFADGMTEELITNLGKISALRVISRTSVMQYKGTKKTLPQIARELNVDAVVEGSVLRSGSRVRITANLLHAPTDRHLWADSYESDLGDVLVLQGEVARAITSEIQIKVTPNEQVSLARAHAVNPESYRLYLQGRYHLHQRTGAAVDKSINLFQQALEKDPDNALGWAGLAQSYGYVAAYYSTTPKEWFGKAKAAALKALEIDSSLAEAHTALGFVHLEWDWDWQAAERELKRGVELKQSDAYARYWY